MSESYSDAINKEIMENIDVCSIANGTMGKAQVKDTLIEQVQTHHLQPLSALRFLRTIGKASGEAEKVKDDDKLTIADKAVIQAESLPELQKALDEGSKEFIWNGGRYQFREEESVDLTTRSGEEAETWRENKKKAEALESQIADLRTKLSDAKGAMSGAEERYIAKHPGCKKTVKRSIVVL